MTNTTWNSSFHGSQEIVADKYQLCAKDVEVRKHAVLCCLCCLWCCGSTTYDFMSNLQASPLYTQCSQAIVNSSPLTCAYIIPPPHTRAHTHTTPRHCSYAGHYHCIRIQANPFDYQWDNFTACFTGDDDGIGICTLYGKGQIDAAAEKCALQVGMEWATLRKCTHGVRHCKHAYMPGIFIVLRTPITMTHHYDSSL